MHREAGIELQVPQPWRVRVDAATSRIEASGGASKAVIWPVFVEGGRRIGEGAVLRHLARRIWPTAALRMANASAARGDYRGRVVSAMLATASTPAGTAIVLYGIEAPPAEFDRTAADAVTMFTSLKISGPDLAAAPAKAALAYTRWADPREGAFSIEVPEGWSVQGGAFRHAAVDVRAMVDARAPDGAVAIRIGDADLPTFTEPLPFFPEGSTYSPGYGVSMRVRRVASGRGFATDYVRSVVSQSCAGVEIIESSDRSDAVQQLNAIYQQYGLAAVMNAGEVTFSCRRGDRVMNGYYFAGIQVVRMGGPAMWRAENLLGYLATPDRAAQAKDVLARMVSTFRLDEAWAARQQQTTAATSAIVTRTNDAISKIISDTYWSRQPVESEISRRRSNATLGVEDVVDDHTGEHYRVESGSNYYWINPRGTIVGTDVDAVPRGDFRALRVQ